MNKVILTLIYLGLFAIMLNFVFAQDYCVDDTQCHVDICNVNSCTNLSIDEQMRITNTSMCNLPQNMDSSKCKCEDNKCVYGENNNTNKKDYPKNGIPFEITLYQNETFVYALDNSISYNISITYMDESKINLDINGKIVENMTERMSGSVDGALGMQFKKINFYGENDSGNNIIVRVGMLEFGSQNLKVKILPEVASEKAKERLGDLGFNITLKEVGNDENKKYIYEAEGEKDVKIFGLFNKKAKIVAKVDAESGEILAVKKPWWAFLASGFSKNESPQLVGGCAGVYYTHWQECCENWARENNIARIKCMGNWTVENNECVWKCGIN